MCSRVGCLVSATNVMTETVKTLKEGQVPGNASTGQNYTEILEPI